jgi:hypothetical protein
VEKTIQIRLEQKIAFNVEKQKFLRNIEVGGDKMKLLCLDPAGNWGKEGFGTTGWSLFEDGELLDFGDIKAENFGEQEAYWEAVADLLYGNEIVVCENYRLYGGARGKAQINSTLDTPQLIGHLRIVCWKENIQFVQQSPAFKVRVADPQLVKMGVLTKKGTKHYCLNRPTNLHQRDAIRHGLYFLRYGGIEEDG